MERPFIAWKRPPTAGPPKPRVQWRYNRSMDSWLVMAHGVVLEAFPDERLAEDRWELHILEKLRARLK
jgi:hypothetical protein